MPDSIRYSKVWSSASIGIDALPIEIETFIASGLPKHTVVGLPRGAVRESLDRIMAALRSTGLPVPRGAITINLAPADVQKDGTAYDLPVALSLLTADRTITPSIPVESVVIMGELALDGKVRPIRGVLSMSLQAKSDGRSAVIVPAVNAKEAMLVRGLTVFPVDSLADAIDVLRGTGSPADRSETADGGSGPGTSSGSSDFSGIGGQGYARRALEIAAAGGHNLLMLGPPGSGKTMLARSIPTILPKLSHDEAIETTRIHSTAGCLGATGLVHSRPFRAPHHTISDAGLVGGGTPPRPGEISLAHRGVLFLDELPEFRRNALESLRQPIENGFIDIVRSQYRTRFPCSIMLVAAMNPCPCGYFGSERPCSCPPGILLRYRNRISGPLLDRIDLHIEVQPVAAAALATDVSREESSATILDRVQSARALQSIRFQNEPFIHSNAEIPPGRLAHFARSTPMAKSLLAVSFGKYRLTPRAYHRILRVARTIADMKEQVQTSDDAIAEALQYRSDSVEDWTNA